LIETSPSFADRFLGSISERISGPPAAVILAATATTGILQSPAYTNLGWFRSRSWIC